MTSVGFPDWGRPVTLADAPFVALSAGVTSGVENSPFFNEPALKYQSYQIQLQFLNGAQSASNYADVIVRFYDNSGVHTTAHVVHEDEIEVNVGAVLTFITDRMHGADMTVTVTFPGGTVTMLWLMSNRPADKLRVLEGPTGRDRILLTKTSVVVGAGLTSAHQFVPHHYGPIKIHFTAGGNGFFTFYAGSLATLLWEENIATGARDNVDFLAPLRPLHWTASNTDAASHTYSIAIWGIDA